MVISDNPSYQELEFAYRTYFSTSFLGNDISNKFALISLTCHITYIIKKKLPDITHLKILEKINKSKSNPLPEDVLIGLAIMCDDFSYGCTSFPTFGIEDKKIPDKIKELLGNWLPF